MSELLAFLVVAFGAVVGYKLTRRRSMPKVTPKPEPQDDYYGEMRGWMS